MSITGVELIVPAPKLCARLCDILIGSDIGGSGVFGGVGNCCDGIGSRNREVSAVEATSFRRGSRPVKKDRKISKPTS
jgi:hypothetical protein